MEQDLRAAMAAAAGEGGLTVNFNPTITNNPTIIGTNTTTNTTTNVQGDYHTSAENNNGGTPPWARRIERNQQQLAESQQQSQRQLQRMDDNIVQFTTPRAPRQSQGQNRESLSPTILFS